jgi:pimeloyl-ACP methyl ester carboxylesterase
VAKLVLIDSAGLAKPPAIGKFMIPPLAALATGFLRNPRVRQNISKAAYFDKQLATRDAQLCAALHLESPNWNQALVTFTKSGGYGSFASQLHQIQQPTLILWGENDQILGIKDATQFEQLLPSSELIWIANCGHVPHLERPQLTAKEILEFCR